MEEIRVTGFRVAKEFDRVGCIYGMVRVGERDTVGDAEERSNMKDSVGEKSKRKSSSALNLPNLNLRTVTSDSDYKIYGSH